MRAGVFTRSLGCGLRLSRWWEWRALAEPSRVLCYARADRRAFVYRSKRRRGTGGATGRHRYCCLRQAPEGLLTFDTWRGAFEAARHHIGDQT